MQLLDIHEPGETPLPHADSAAVGIDLGTTNSVVAIAHGGEVEVLRDICGGALVPSVVNYHKGVIKVGRDALAALAEVRGETVRSIKRLMGRSALEAQSMGEYPLARKEGLARLKLDGRELTPVEISAEILRHLKKLAENALSKEVKQAVITVPAYFDDGARQATKDAAKLAGLEVLRLVNEPTAAALAYGLDNAAAGIYAVYDLGGGTFDISILKMQMGVFQVLSTGGDVALGGDDFDRALLEFAMPQKSPSQIQLLEARKVKEALSEAEEARLEGVEVTRAQYEQQIEPFVARTLQICAQAMRDAKVTKEEIKGVVLVGGATRTPLVRKKVSELFGTPPLDNVNPDEVVAAGAALQAEALTRGSDNLLLDVLPLSLGLETMGGLVEKIIHRNSTIPAIVSQEFTTWQDGQSGMVIHVVQGERELVDQNRSLAKFELSGIPPLPAGIARVKVTFAVDADGLLSVSAQEAMTGVEQKIEVKPSYGLNEDEMIRMLEESMEHAREDITARLLAEAKMEAERSLIELQSALKLDGDLLEAKEKQALEAQEKKLRQLLKGSDRDAIDLETQALHNLVRPFAERRMDKAIGSALKGAHIDETMNE